MHRMVNSVILFCGLVTCGCAAAIIGAGAGAGAAVYLKGRVTKTYDAEYHPGVRACLDTLNSLQMPVTGKTADALKTSISARRADGTPVSVEVVWAGPARTEVSVRTGAVGITEVDVSEMIQNRIAERLAAMAVEGPKAAESSSPKHPPETVERLPAPAPRPETAPKKAGTASNNTLAKRRLPEVILYFDQDSNELRQDEITKLNALVEFHLNQPELKLILDGYSDSSGPIDYNRMVSESRASTVKMYLVGKGVDPSRISAFGHGSRSLPVRIAGEEGRRLNRCVEVYVEGR